MRGSQKGSKGEVVGRKLWWHMKAWKGPLYVVHAYEAQGSSREGGRRLSQSKSTGMGELKQRRWRLFSVLKCHTVSHIHVQPTNKQTAPMWGAGKMNKPCLPTCPMPYLVQNANGGVYARANVQQVFCLNGVQHILVLSKVVTESSNRNREDRRDQVR